MTKLEELRHERERLENEVAEAESAIEYLKQRTLPSLEEELGRLVMNLNRARRLEREELQNAKQQS